MPYRRRSDATPRRDPISEAIATRAYERFLARGCEHGHDVEDWLAAERELVARQQSNAAASAPPSAMRLAMT